MTNKYWESLSEDEQKAYIIGYDAGKGKGTMKGFAIGAAVGMIVTIISVCFFLG